MDLKRSMRGSDRELATRERKCSSRVIIGLILFEFRYGSGDSFNKAEDRKRRVSHEGAKERAGLISE